MRKILFALILFLLVSTCSVFAQDTLPKISIRALSNKILVSWRNEYKKTVTIIDIQRSYDSIRNFATIGTILNPESEDNGFVDTKPPKVKCYYRLFIAFEGGDYVFSRSYRKPEKISPVIAAPEHNNIPTQNTIVPVKTPDNIIIATPNPVTPIKTPPAKAVPVKVIPVKKDTVQTESTPAPVIVIPKKTDVVVAKEDLINLKRLPKNIVTVDYHYASTRYMKIQPLNSPALVRQRLAIDINPDSRDVKRIHINIKRDSTDIIARMPFAPSKFINIGKDNDVVINLPLFASKKYSIRFYNEKDTSVLFEINKITEPYLILEKANFRHSGWFRYHLYSFGALVEKYKIYIAIDDKTVPIVKEKADPIKER
ncbi:MAG TPA: hypothetical protein VK559_00845 [Ferruginibacter sp.]|nr:hypothetical protein [Ferruginibacter sp.]